jgi:tetratricopeptide (TPR) repeat protein
MLQRRWMLMLLLSFAVSATAQNKKMPVPPQVLPITTSSPQARQSFERAMRRFEDYHLDETLQDLRLATKADPDFAQALILTAHLSRDPAEQRQARKKAEQLAPKVSSGEQLLIHWMAASQEGDHIQAIAAMNDLLADYPKDRRLAFMAGGWLNSEQRYEQAATVLERALALYPDYPAALNNIAYAYAYSGNFDKAFAAMDRYVALEPDEPNAHDSYGEILRMAGKFDAALDQYRMSVRLDPNFGSEVGIADTYALMGREQDARDEYGRAIVFAGNMSNKIDFELQSAATWIRESNRKQAERSLSEVAKHAHAAGLANLEAEAHRILGLYEPDVKSAMKQLQAAQQVLEEPHEISPSDRAAEQARILRAEVMRSAEAGELDSAATAFDQLKILADKSRSQIVQLCYHGASGALLIAQGKSADAIADLEEDSNDPLSMRLLWKAYNAVGASEQAQAMAARLSALNVPTIEQALVVPQFRATLVSQAGQP